MFAAAGRIFFCAREKPSAARRTICTVRTTFSNMPTDPSDPSTPTPPTRLYQTTSEAPKGGGGGIFIVILLLLLLGGAAAYYFLVYKPGAVAAAALPSPTPAATRAPVAATPDTSGNPTYNSNQRTQYIKQAEEAFNAQRLTKSQPFTDSFNALLAAGSFTAAGLTSKEAITARRDLVTKVQTANDDLEAFIKTQEATYKAELQKTPLIPNDVDYVLSDFVYKAQTEKALKLRDLQRESLKTGDAMLDYLEKSYGNWSINATQRLTFKKPADGGAFNTLGKTYNSQITEMAAIQKDILTTADPNSTPGISPAASPAPAASATP